MGRPAGRRDLQVGGVGGSLTNEKAQQKKAVRRESKISSTGYLIGVVAVSWLTANDLRLIHLIYYLINLNLV